MDHTDSAVLEVARRWEASSTVIGGYTGKEWSVIRDHRTPHDESDVIWRGPACEREAFCRALLIAQMRYALEGLV